MEGVAWEHLISPLEIQLHKKILATAEVAIRAFYKISRSENYVRALGTPPPVGQKKSRHHSVLMAYDFHTAEDGSCKLVEINTNGSGFMLASLLYAVKSGEKLDQFSPLNRLYDSFLNEMKLWGGSKASEKTVAIVDENVLTQKMYPEFLMYQDWFSGQGWKANILDVENVDDSALIYNRSTDFYLDQPQSEILLKKYLAEDACITPNPYEYWLLADKERLIQLGLESFWQSLGASTDDRSAIESVLIPTFDKSAFGDEQELWDKRKTLFFKPKRAYGGKSVYRGESVSRKVFERLMLEDILVQKFFPAQKVPTDDPRSVLNNWKFDLRLFVYEDKIQLAVARSYQGQVTNFASEYGGFTFVQF